MSQLPSTSGALRARPSSGRAATRLAGGRSLAAATTRAAASAAVWRAPCCTVSSTSELDELLDAGLTAAGADAAVARDPQREHVEILHFVSQTLVDLPPIAQA